MILDWTPCTDPECFGGAPHDHPVYDVVDLPVPNPGVVAAILALHRVNTRHTHAVARSYCRECGFPYPCRTVELLS